LDPLPFAQALVTDELAGTGQYTKRPAPGGRAIDPGRRDLEAMARIWHRRLANRRRACRLFATANPNLVPSPAV